MILEKYFNEKEIFIINQFNDNPTVLPSKYKYKLIQKLINIDEFDDYFQCKCSKGLESNCKHYKNCFCSNSDYKQMHSIFKEKLTEILK